MGEAAVVMPGNLRDRSYLAAKRILDMGFAGAGLIGLSPVLLTAMALVYRQDRHSPFYLGRRVSQGGGSVFNMVKLRSMVMNADQIGGDSTSSDDNRITPVGNFIRKYKLDELMQLWNVLKGEMSLVGPRPQVQADVDLYTDEEMRMLEAKPGITDLASIVFSDEGEILKGAEDPDLKYNQVIRPWKSRLALFYLENQSVLLDLKIIVLTAIAVVNKQKALELLHDLLSELGADEQLVKIASRRAELEPFPPPGSSEVVQSRSQN